MRVSIAAVLFERYAFAIPFAAWTAVGYGHSSCVISSLDLMLSDVYMYMCLGGAA